jgi:hypothetical protein
MRAKFRRQQVRWSTAYQDAWAAAMLTRSHLDAVTSAAGGMTRAWQALAAAASEAGHRPLSPEVWETTLADGTVAAIVRTNDEAAQVIASGREVAVYTLREVAHVIDALPAACRWRRSSSPARRCCRSTVALVDLKPQHCRWPIGDPVSGPFGFCGCARIETGPYCRAHNLQAHDQAANARVKKSGDLARSLRRHA